MRKALLPVVISVLFATGHAQVNSSERLIGLPSDMIFEVIPSGSFSMGTPETDTARGLNETEHRVYLDSYELMTTEVTQGMWKTVMGTSPSTDCGEGSNYPVYNVSWNDCQEFIRKLNELDRDHTYRLPTESEWEYACRAGTVTRYYWGDTDSLCTVDHYCWFADKFGGTSGCCKDSQRLGIV